MPWRFVPQELACGSGVTCWRRLQEWTQAGIWPRIHKKLLGVLGRRGRIDASLVVLDGAIVRALLGGAAPDPIPRIVRKKAANAMF